MQSVSAPLNVLLPLISLTGFHWYVTQFVTFRHLLWNSCHRLTLYQLFAKENWVCSSSSCFGSNFRGSVKRLNTPVSFPPCQPLCRRLLHNRPDAVRASASGGEETVRRLRPVHTPLNEPAALQQQHSSGSELRVRFHCAFALSYICLGLQAFPLCQLNVSAAATEITLGLKQDQELTKIESVKT